MKSNVINGYTHSALELVDRFEAISTDEVFTPISHLLPNGKLKVLDIGAGTGRDAAWFALRGQSVLAVEPVAEFRAVGKALHQFAEIEWLADDLPGLANVRARQERYDVLLLNGVLHHLEDSERAEAISNLEALLAPDGVLIMSLRHGPGPSSRPCYAIDPETIASMAAQNGLRLEYSQAAPSIQAGNRAAIVTWTWLVYRFAFTV